MGDHPKRKRLRLKNYDYAREGYYFLTLCTKGRRQILSEVSYDDRHCTAIRLTPYGTIVEAFIRSIPGIDKYVIMPNHIHMIIHKSNGKSIVSDMRAFKSLITKTIGTSIWQPSYYDHVIRNDADYLEKWRYIEENPARWAEDEYNA